jgi:hypothetical protein
VSKTLEKYHVSAPDPAGFLAQEIIFWDYIHQPSHRNSDGTVRSFQIILRYFEHFKKPASEFPLVSSPNYEFPPLFRGILPPTAQTNPIAPSMTFLVTATGSMYSGSKPGSRFWRQKDKYQTEIVW